MFITFLFFSFIYTISANICLSEITKLI